MAPHGGRQGRPTLQRISSTIAGLFFATVLLGEGGCGSSPKEGVVLRMATTQQGEQLREPFRVALRGFERQHPGVRVEVVEMDDDVYQKMGLVTLFVGGTPPDLYFQWGGFQVRKWAAAGYALDLTPELEGKERERYLPFCWASCRDDQGRIALWPNTASVTTVLWYRVSLFKRLGLTPPTRWDEFLGTCERLRGAGVIPVALGNRELWPGGNFAAWMIAQYAGVQHYNDVLSLQPGTRLDDPDFVAALEFLADLQQRGLTNRGVSGVGTDEARSLLMQEKAAYDPVGDWLVSEADAGAVRDLDAMRLPRMPSQQGDDTTLLALTTGYMIHRQTSHPREAIVLLRYLSSDAVQQEWARHGHLSAVRAAGPPPDAPGGQHRLMDFMDQARASALAPDVGFDLEVSDAFLDAVSLVLGGRASPAEALAQADRQVSAMREIGSRAARDAPEGASTP